MRGLYLCLLFFLSVASLKAQEKKKQKKKKSDEPKNWVLQGYLKHMSGLYIFNNPDLVLQDNLLHNRLNFTWYINDAWNFKTSLRTRVLYGERIKLQQPLLAEQIKQSSNAFLPLSWNLIDRDAAILNTALDRLYVQYSKGNWDIRLGRQRINWGINTFWNPNDIFNTYSFVDFDYEERPGTDALRVQYYTGVASSLEFAVNAFDDWREASAAILWKTNKWNYDFQALAGLYQEHLVLGGGWAGNIKNAGFKGECSYFYQWDTLASERSSFALTLGVDYSLEKGTYFNTGLLYNSRGVTSGSALNLFAFELSAKNLYPYRYSAYLMVSHPITPNLNAVLTTIYSPGDSHLLFLNPAVTYVIKDNWDLDLVGQIVFNKDGGKYYSPLQSIFLRVKWSF